MRRQSGALPLEKDRNAGALSRERLDLSAGDVARARFTERQELAAVVIGTGALLLFHLGAYGLWDPDESRWAEIAREMLALHDFILPHLNYVPYLEKPPLLYWITALSFLAFGLNEFAARLSCAIPALGGIIVTYLFVRRTFDRSRATLAVAILATTPLYAVMAQVLTTDFIFTFCVTASWFAFFLHWRESGDWCWIGYIAAALGVLAKGPFAIVLCAGVMLIFLWWEGELPGSVRRFRLVAGSALIAAIVAPWFIAVSIREPDFASFYFGDEILRRFLQSNYDHGQPIYYFVPVLIAGTAPYSIIAAFLRKGALGANPARSFCVIAAVFTFVFFSLSAAKLIPYILPALPPLAIGLADALMNLALSRSDHSTCDGDLDVRRLVPAGVIVALLGTAAIITGFEARNFNNPYPLAIRGALLSGGVLALIGGTTASYAWWRGRLIAGISSIVIASAVVLICASYGRIDAEPLRSYADLSRKVARLAPTARLICYQRYVQALPFYTRRRTILVGAKTELSYGAAHASDAADYFFNGADELLRLWDQPGASVIILDNSDLKTLAPRLGSYSLIASEHQKKAILGIHLSATLAPSPGVPVCAPLTNKVRARRERGRQ